MYVFPNLVFATLALCPLRNFGVKSWESILCACCRYPADTNTNSTKITVAGPVARCLAVYTLSPVVVIALNEALLLHKLPTRS